MALRETQIDVTFDCDISEVAKMDDLVDSLISDVTGGLSKAEGGVNELASGFGDMSQDAVKDIGKISRAVDDIKSDMGRAEGATTGLKTSIGKIGSEAKTTSQKVQGLGSDIATEVGDKAKKEVDELSSSIEGLGGLISGLGAGAMAGNVIGSTNDIQVAMNGLKAQTGLTDEEMVDFGKSMQNLYDNNLGEDLGDVANTMARVKQQFKDVDATAVENISKQALVLRDTFDMDLNETLRGANSLMINMGVDAETAFNLMAKGAQNGLNKTDELGDNIAEYGQVWGQAGFSAEEMFGILQNGLDSGAYNLDKVNDFVKEFTISLSDGRIEENLDSFSQGTQDLFKDFQNGKATAKDVFGAVITDMEGMENKQEALTLASNVWSSLGEDNAMSIITSLNDVNTTYDNVGGTMETINEIKYNDAGSALQALGRTANSELGTKLIPLIETANTAIKWMGENWDWLGPILTGVAVFIGLLATAWGVYTIAQNIANMAIWSCPVTWIVVAIMAVIAIIVVVILYFDEIVAWLGKLWNSIVTWLTPIATWINDNVIQPIVEFFVGLWEKITGIFTAVITWVKDNFQSILLFIINPFAGVFHYLYNNFEGFRNFVDGIVQSVVGFFVGLWNKIVEIFSAVGSFFTNAFLSAYNGIVNIFSKIIGFFSGLWNSVTSLFTTAGQAIGDAVSGAFRNSVNAVLGFAERILNGFTSKINGAIDIINKIPSVSISKLPTFSIPRLATGGIVDSSTVANIGEAGAEAVVPLENNLGWLDKMANMIVGAMYQQSAYTPETTETSNTTNNERTIIVESGAITITVEGGGDSDSTADKVKQKIEEFFEDLRNDNKPVFDY